MHAFRTLLAATALTLACGSALVSPALAAPQAAVESAPASASGGGLIAQTKIAVVNIQGIMHDAPAAKSVREQLEAKQKTYQAEISKKEEALQKEEQELSKERSALSQEAFDAKVKAFRTKETAAQKEVQEKKQVLDAAFERALNQIQQAVGQIISDMAKEKGFAMVFPTSQMLYADSALDISQEVLSKLNQRLPKVEVKFEAADATEKHSK